jgi:hypothetical protein
MGDSYNDKPVSNLKVSDVLGMLVIAGFCVGALYLLFMLIFHLIAGHPPP